MPAKWFCQVDGAEIGPLSQKQLVEMVQSSRLKPSDFVRKDDSPWVLAESVRGLFPRANPAAANTGNVVSQPPPNLIEATIAWNSSSGGEPRQESAKPSPTPQTSASNGKSPKTVASILDELNLGSQIGNYQIVEVLGEGGMGVVLKAQHTRMERTVALKVLRREATQSATAIKRFQQEVRAAAKLSHPNIVTAYDADEVRGIHFLVMEYVEGMSLADLLARDGKLPVPDVLQYVVQTAIGLEYAHGQGVVHRDVKPGNLLLDRRGVVKILDMGLAAIKQTRTVKNPETPQESLTDHEHLLGTFDYMSPEQAEDPHSADHRADIYSLGCSMYRLLTARSPYPAESSMKKILAHRESPLPSLRDLRPEVMFDLEKVFRRMIAKKPHDRYQSMVDLIRDLQMCLHGKTLSAASVTPFIANPNDDGTVWQSRETVTDSEVHLRAADESIRIEVPVDSDDDDFGLAAIETPKKARRYFWLVMGQEMGPLTKDQLIRKRIQPDDLVRFEDSNQWVPASEMTELFS